MIPPQESLQREIKLERPNDRSDRGGVAPNVTRSAWLALRALSERLAVLPTPASIRVPVAPPAAAPAPAAVPAPAAAAPISLLDLSSGIAVRDNRGGRLLRDAAWKGWQGKCHRAGGYGRSAKEQSTPRTAPSIHTKCPFQHVSIS